MSVRCLFSLLMHPLSVTSTLLQQRSVQSVILPVVIPCIKYIMFITMGTCAF